MSENNLNNNNNNKPDPSKAFFKPSMETIDSTYLSETSREHLQKIRDDIYDEILTKLEGRKEKVAGIIIELIIKHSMQILEDEVKEFNDTGVLNAGIIHFYPTFCSALRKAEQTVQLQGQSTAKFIIQANAESNLRWKQKQNNGSERKEDGM